MYAIRSYYEDLLVLGLRIVLLHFGPDRQDVAVDRYVDVILADAGDFGFDDDILVIVLDLDLDLVRRWQRVPVKRLDRVAEWEVTEKFIEDSYNFV